MSGDSEELGTGGLQATSGMSLSATIEREPLVEFLEGVNTIVDEARLHIDNEGLSVAAVDPANVSMAEAELSADAFEEYRAVKNEVGVYVRGFLDIVERFEGRGLITLEYNAAQDYIAVSAGDYEYTYKVLDPEKVRKEPDLPTLELPAHLEIEVDEFAEAVWFINEFSDHVWIGYEDARDEFYMEDKSDDRNAGEYRRSAADLPDVPKEGFARSRFSLDYLKDWTDGFPEGRVATMELGEEFPMKFTYGIAPDGEEFHGEVKLMLAPRIE